MDKTIYQLLNEVETDFLEYEKTELSLEEKERMKTKILMEVKDMKAKNRKEKRKGSKKAAAMVGMAAAAAVVIGAVGAVSNPVLAKQIFGNVFGFLINSSEDGYIGEKAQYEKVGENAAAIQEEINKYAGSGDFITSVEQNGVELSVSDVYCDGSVLYYTFVLRTDNEDVNKGDGVILYYQDDRLPGMTAERSDGSNVPISGGTVGQLKKAADGSYVGMEELDLYGTAGSYDEPLNPNEDESIILNYTVHGVTGIKDEFSDKNGCFEETARVDGEWKLRFPVTVDGSDNETIEINKEENGIIVKDVTRSKTSLIVKVNYSGHATKPPYDYQGCPAISVKDSEGNYLDGMGGGSGGSEPFTIQDRFLYDGQKDLVIEISDYISETDTVVPIAEIPVTLP